MIVFCSTPHPLNPLIHVSHPLPHRVPSAWPIFVYCAALGETYLLCWAWTSRSRIPTLTLGPRFPPPPSSQHYSVSLPDIPCICGAPAMPFSLLVSFSSSSSFVLVFNHYPLWVCASSQCAPLSPAHHASVKARPVPPVSHCSFIACFRHSLRIPPPPCTPHSLREPHLSKTFAKDWLLRSNSRGCVWKSSILA